MFFSELVRTELRRGENISPTLQRLIMVWGRELAKAPGARGPVLMPRWPENIGFFWSPSVPVLNRKMLEDVELFCLNVYDNIRPHIDRFFVSLFDSNGVVGYANNFGLSGYEESLMGFPRPPGKSGVNYAARGDVRPFLISQYPDIKANRQCCNRPFRVGGFRFAARRLLGSQVLRVKTTENEGFQIRT